MEQNKKNIEQLLEGYLQQTLSEAERMAFFEMISEDDSLLPGLSEKMPSSFSGEKPIDPGSSQSILGAILHDKQSSQPAEVVIHPSSSRNRILPGWRWIAASALLIMATGGYFLINKNQPKLTGNTQETITIADIEPGKEGAILTLADGSKIVLDSLNNGVITTQNGVKTVLRDGQLIYSAETAAAGLAVYNTVSTPKGRQFRLQLPDGSNVWLNAASSIRYPTLFKEKRQVEVTGEAYFEVAKNTAMPFIVNVNHKEEIKVLGTSFNVNAYDNENSVNTTLLEGSVSISTVLKGTPDQLGKAVMLKPGQQAKLADDIKVINNADLGKIMAWKDGLFNFDNASLHEVMQQLERWYDLQVIYEGNIPSMYFEGEMSREMNLSEVLNGLQKTGVRFRIEEGKRLVVLKH